MKSKIILVLIFFALFFGMVVFSLTNVKSSLNYIDTYFEGFNYSFGGKVVAKNHFGSGIGLVTLDLSFSDTDLYDPRDSVDVYFSVIKGGRAEIITRFYDINIGDSIVFNGKVDSLRVFRNGVRVGSWKPYISNVTGIYKEIRADHKL